MTTKKVRLEDRRIRWSKVEVEKIMKDAVDRLIVKDMPIPDAFRMAQNVLPQERRKRNPTLFLYSKNNESGGSYLQDLKRMLAKRQSQISEPEKVEEVNWVEAINQTVDQAAKYYEARLRLVLSQVTEKGFHEVNANIQNKFGMVAPVGSIGSVIPESTTKVKKKRILIIGPLPGQQKTLMKDWGSYYDLRFVSSEENPRRVQEKYGTCDAVIGMVRKVNHAHCKVPGIIYVDGDLSSVELKLLELLPEGESK